MASLSADYKAMVVGDTIEIVVVQGLTSSNANSVSAARTLEHQFGH
jgi:flagellar basal body L-ring protein FlgH